ncbi:MAG TPA: hypothetical protein PKD63_05030 [Solirubrobacteraceae bacterium]|nr:hypothetical protein [Solirubrobacteraceae bacterium]
MTSFCRHRRLESTCPICSRKREQERRAKAPPRRTGSGPAAPAGVRRSGPGRRRAPTGNVRVRRLARAADDGYASVLVPGLRATADAELLAQELAFATARLTELQGDAPPGLYGEAARLAAAGDLEEALWLTFLTGLVGPLAGEDDAFAEIEALRVPWATGELPRLEGARFGPRGATDAASADRALAAYRTWAERAGGQVAALAGEAAWTPERRFDRAFERLALPGLGRGQRYEILLTAGALGLADLRAAALHLLGADRDPAVVAAKRVFGIGDLLLVARRAADLATACALPAAALDLALVNWGRLTDDPHETRITCGSHAEPDPDALDLAREALELAGERDGDDGDDPDLA